MIGVCVVGGKGVHACSPAWVCVVGGAPRPPPPTHTHTHTHTHAPSCPPLPCNDTTPADSSLSCPPALPPLQGVCSRLPPHLPPPPVQGVRSR